MDLNTVIRLFGHSEDEFADWDDLEEYLREELAIRNRYRYSKKFTEVNVVLLSFKGEIKGELMIVRRDKPTFEDIEDYQSVYGKPPIVYIINSISIYENRVIGSECGITGVEWFGSKPISQEKYEAIQLKAGKIETIKVASIMQEKKPKIFLKEGLEDFPVPDSTWTEQDTKIKIVVPLLELLGYDRDNMIFERSFKFGTISFYVDIIVDDLLCEVKRPTKDLSGALPQAIDYAKIVPDINCILVTNGKQFKWRKKVDNRWLQYDPLEDL